MVITYLDNLLDGNRNIQVQRGFRMIKGWKCLIIGVKVESIGAESDTVELI